MFNKEDVTILIPVLNEENTVSNVIQSFKKMGYSNILAVDGNSTDNTQNILENSNVSWFTQTAKGKGNAVIEGFSRINTPYTILIDADGTNNVLQADNLIEKMIKENLEHIIGNRLKHFQENAFTKLNFIGNKIINKIFKFKTGVNMIDILSGYRAFTLNCIKQLNLTQQNFNIEVEMSIEIAKKKIPFGVLDTYYSKRLFSKTKLKPFKDGFNIIKFILTH